MLQFDYLFKRLRIDSFTSLLATAKRVSKKTGKALPLVIADMLYCIVRHETGFFHYEIYRMYELSKADRKRFLTVGRNNRLVRKLNDPNEIRYFENKIEFCRMFSDYLGRDWIELKPNNAAEFVSFCQGKNEIIAKPAEQCGGKGIQKIRIDSETDLYALHTRLRAEGCDLAEDVLRQCSETAALCSTSVNTVRVVTLLRNDGTVAIGSVTQRFGREGNYVDNFHSGGYAMLLDIQTGKPVTETVDVNNHEIEFIPSSRMRIRDYQAPCMDKVIALVKEAALRIPKVRYIGWDVCIDKDHIPHLIEGNTYPTQDATQNLRKNIGTYDSYKKLLS